jgi:hypothetical protein
MRQTFVILSLLAVLLLVPSLTYAQPTQWTSASGGNDHWYELILNPATWDQANTLAAASSWNGASGHLVTLTSAAEGDFVYQLLNPNPTDVWLGGYQEPYNNPDPSAGWHWVTGEAWSYTNWYAGGPYPAEPNDYPAVPQFHLAYYYNLPFWCDEGVSGGSDAYIVEYEPTVSDITITTDPPNLSFTVDGQPYTGSQTFSWVVGNSHTIAATTPQGSGGTRYVFANWSDSGAISHAVTVPANATTYTAQFTTQYLLTTAVSPSAGGTVVTNPSSTDGYYTSGASVQLTATANSSYVFFSWSGDLTGSTNPQSVTMSAPRSATANFSSTTSEITITTDPANLSFTVDGQPYTGSQTFSWVVGNSHTIAATTPQGSGGTRYVFAHWSDGIANSHSITTPAIATTYTASFTTQYQLTTAASPASGGTISANPTSVDGFYNRDAFVHLAATPNANYLFSGWSGDLMGTLNPRTIMMSGPTDVIASFLSSGGGCSLTLSPGGAATCATAGLNEAIQTGYATVDVNSGNAPYGTAVFSFKQNGVTVSEAGVPASPPRIAARVFIDYRSSVAAIPARPEAGTIDINTGIAVANSGSSSAHITYTLRNVAGGTLSVGSGTLDPRAHFAKFINQLNDVAEGFVLPEDFQIDNQFASLEISSDQPVSIIAMRIAINQRNEVLFTTTPIADLTQPSTNDVVFFPQFADGGGNTTSIVLLNTSSQIETGTIQIMDDNGNPLVVNWVGGTADSMVEYTIPVGGLARFQTDGIPAASKAGWAKLTPEAGTSTPIGAGVFSYNPGSFLLFESGVPATLSTTHARIYVDLSAGHNTGLAIANPTDSNADISITAFESDGVTEVGSSRDPLQLPANGHQGHFANEFVSGLPAGFTGVLDISSPTPFAALTMRSLDNERHEFLAALFPVADMTRNAPAPLVFPQIADGGGYVTQFILISAGETSSSTLIFYDENGAPTDFGN